MIQRRHLLMVCPACCDAGAVANVALHQARELARYFRVSLLSDSFPAAGLLGVTFHRLNPPRFGWLRRFGHVPREVAFALSAKSAIRQLHTRGGVDVVLCHGHPVAALAGNPLKRRYGIPYAMVTHGDIFDRPKGTYDPRLTWFYRQVTQPAYRGADLVVALSPYMREMALRGGAAPERVTVIPNGIDHREMGLDGNLPVVLRHEPTRPLDLLYVGRLSVEKGAETLIEAAAILRDRGVRFRMRMVGAGPQAQALSRRASELKLNDAVQWIGTLPRLELGPLYRSGDIVCVPSWTDALPTVVLEAMAAGVPVVGSNVGGIPYLIEDGVTGLIFQARNPVALADTLQSLGQNRVLIGRMGEAGRRRIARKFNWSDIGQSLTQAIVGICPGTPQGLGAPDRLHDPAEPKLPGVGVSE